MTRRVERFSWFSEFERDMRNTLFNIKILVRSLAVIFWLGCIVIPWKRYVLRSLYRLLIRLQIAWASRGLSRARQKVNMEYPAIVANPERMEQQLVSYEEMLADDELSPEMRGLVERTVWLMQDHPSNVEALFAGEDVSEIDRKWRRLKRDWVEHMEKNGK